MVGDTRRLTMQIMKCRLLRKAKSRRRKQLCLLLQSVLPDWSLGDQMKISLVAEETAQTPH